MHSIFDYLTWRGDLTMDQDGFRPVDGLLFSAFSYLHPDVLFADKDDSPVSIIQLSDYVDSLDEEKKKEVCRCEEDLQLLSAMKKSRRYGGLKLIGFYNLLDEKNEIQLTAFAIGLGRAGTLLLYRGTDSSVIGWKEDFNMLFMDNLPGQEEAMEFFVRTAQVTSGPLYLAGHSKGGNFAVYSAACAPPEIQSRVKAIYNYDGPGFSEAFVKTDGYRSILPLIHTYVPQSSVVGMLLSHREPYKVVESSTIGPFQHDPYSWNVLGGGFVQLEEVDSMSQYLSETLHIWLKNMSLEERESFVEKAYNIVSETKAQDMYDLLKPGNVYIIMKKLGATDRSSRAVLKDAMKKLRQAAFRSRRVTSKQE